MNIDYKYFQDRNWCEDWNIGKILSEIFSNNPEKVYTPVEFIGLDNLTIEDRLAVLLRTEFLPESDLKEIVESTIKYVYANTTDNKDHIDRRVEKFRLPSTGIVDYYFWIAQQSERLAVGAMRLIFKLVKEKL